MCLCSSSSLSLRGELLTCTLDVDWRHWLANSLMLSVQDWYSVGQFDIVNFRSTDELIPTSWPCCPLFHPPLRHTDHTTSSRGLRGELLSAVIHLSLCLSKSDHSEEMLPLTSLCINVLCLYYVIFTHPKLHYTQLFPHSAFNKRPCQIWHTICLEAALSNFFLLSSFLLAGIFSGLELWLWSLLMWLTT